jgi:hypothetical protein
MFDRTYRMSNASNERILIAGKITENVDILTEVITEVITDYRAVHMEIPHIKVSL